MENKKTECYCGDSLMFIKIDDKNWINPEKITRMEECYLHPRSSGSGADFCLIHIDQKTLKVNCTIEELFKRLEYPNCRV